MIPPPIPPQYRPAKPSVPSRIADKCLDWLLDHPPIFALVLSVGLVGIILFFIVVSRPHDDPLPSAQQVPQRQLPEGSFKPEPKYKHWVSPAGRLHIGTDIYISVLNRSPELVFTVLEPVDPDRPECMIVCYPNGSVERKLRSAFTDGDDDIRTYLVWDYD